MPKISVIMPFYNCEKYLDESISSILNQTFSDFEFIIINDASTDNSDEIIKKYLSDTRIAYKKNEENVWIVENLNYWISIAKWKYIARMDGDDISSLDRFEKQYNFLEKNKDVSIVGGLGKVIDEDWNEIWDIIKPLDSEIIKKELFMYLTIIHWASMIRKNVYLQIGTYNQEYLYIEDNEWTYRAIYWNQLKWWNIGDCLYYYRKHSNSSYSNARTIAKRMFFLRKMSIKKYQLKIGLKWYVWMYVHFILWLLLSWKHKEMLERFIKKLISK